MRKGSDGRPRCIDEAGYWSAERGRSGEHRVVHSREGAREE